VYKRQVTVFWFRRDLRLEDNAGLYAALQTGLPVLPLFIFDTEILSQLADKHDKRVDFIHEALAAIDTQLKTIGSSLCIKYGKPVDIFEKLCTEYEIKSVFANRDYEPYALTRDSGVETLLLNKGVDFLTFKDQVIFEHDEILKSNGEPYTVFTPYSKAWKQRLDANHYRPYPSESGQNYLQFSARFPKIEEFGFFKTNIVFSAPTIETPLISDYDKTRNFPSLKGTSELSTHLRFGTVSIRRLAAIALKTNETWLNELIWREFFKSILMHFPYVANGAFKRKFEDIPWRNNENEFARWCEGQTGYPIVDAGMRQLNETGWMHNRVRMITASFLTKHLLIDWRWGEAYFATKLLDYDLSANNGNWQWAAGCGCDAAPYFRIFNPAEQTKKFDPDLLYIRRWIPELDSFEYPQPMVEHTFARNRALNTFTATLKNEFTTETIHNKLK
jgi:deoxyribodipyrimidine photo-lyase